MGGGEARLMAPGPWVGQQDTERRRGEGFSLLPPKDLCPSGIIALEVPPSQLFLCANHDLLLPGFSCTGQPYSL